MCNYTPRVFGGVCESRSMDLGRRGMRVSVGSCGVNKNMYVLVVAG